MVLWFQEEETELFTPIKQSLDDSQPILFL